MLRAPLPPEQREVAVSASSVPPPLRAAGPCLGGYPALWKLLHLLYILELSPYLGFWPLQASSAESLGRGL